VPISSDVEFLSFVRHYNDLLYRFTSNKEEYLMSRACTQTKSYTEVLDQSLKTYIVNNPTHFEPNFAVPLCAIFRVRSFLGDHFHQDVQFLPPLKL
jgi:hypothetical protein